MKSLQHDAKLPIVAVRVRPAVTTQLRRGGRRVVSSNQDSWKLVRRARQPTRPPLARAARDELQPLVRARAHAGSPLQPACRPRVPPRRSDAPTDAAAHPSTLTSAVRAKCAAITERARVWSADVALAHRVLCSFPLSRGCAGPRRLYSASRRALFAGLVARVLRSIRGEACATGDAVHARALSSPPLLAHVACSLTLYSRTRPLSRIPPLQSVLHCPENEISWLAIRDFLVGNS